MISGIVPFEEIVQSVKDETGIENLRPYYEKIRRLIFRGEREIGYGGSVEIMKKKFVVSQSPNNDCGANKYFKFPEGFIEFEGVGISSKKINPNEYTVTAEGIRFRKSQVKNIVLLYWGIQTDDNGYPIVTRNHEEAVVAYIVWKLYSQRIFLGIGNMNANQDYKQNFTMHLLEARGDDAFPTLEEWDALGTLSYTDRRLLIEEKTFTYSYEEDDCDSTDNTDPIEVDERMVHYWQLNSYTDKIEEVKAVLDENYLLTKPSKTFQTFESYQTINYTTVGRIVFVITKADASVYQILDALGNEISSAFDKYYDTDLLMHLFVGKDFISNSNISFKFKKI